jgi:hypothetical protein
MFELALKYSEKYNVLANEQKNEGGFRVDATFPLHTGL